MPRVAKKSVQAKDKLYQLRKGLNPLTYIIKNGRRGDLIIYKDNKNRAIRFCPNEQSVYVDEQSEFALVQDVIFEKGILNVPAREVIKQQFLDEHPDNIANGGGLFKELDEEKGAEEAVNKEDLILDIKYEIRNKAKEKNAEELLKPVASVILNSIDKANRMTIKELQNVLYRKAESNPQYFIDNKGNVDVFENESNFKRYFIMTALKDGVIKQSFDKKAFIWGDTKELIAQAPRGVELIDFFIEFIGTQEGILVAEEIKKRS